MVAAVSVTLTSTTVDLTTPSSALYLACNLNPVKFLGDYRVMRSFNLNLNTILISISICGLFSQSLINN